MKLVYLKSALKYNSFDVAIGIKIPFFRVLVTIEPGRSLQQFHELFDYFYYSASNILTINTTTQAKGNTVKLSGKS